MFCSAFPAIPSNSTLKIANQRFIVHLHSDISCEACSELEDRSNLVPLLEQLPVKANQAQSVQEESPQQKTRTKDEKWKDYKSDMKSLRANLLSRPIASGSASSSRPAIRDVSPSTTPAVEESRPVQYIDRAKLRRTTYGSSQPLSDAQPARRSTALEAKPVATVEPSYGMGQALFAKMSRHEQDEEGQRQMGSIIEVKTTDRKGAGLGSGTMRKGVDEVANQSTDWKGAARDRRWQDAQRQ